MLANKRQSLSFEVMAPDIRHVLFLPDTADALSSIETYLVAHPDCTVLFVTHVDIALSDQLTSALERALRNEKVFAAEAYEIDDVLFDAHSEEFTPQISPALRRNAAAIRCDLVRDYLPDLRADLGSFATIRDIGLYVNRLGFSTVEVAVRASITGAASHNSQVESQPRQWDEYISHVERFWERNPRNVWRQFSHVLEPHTRPQVLIDASGLSPQRNGTSRVVLGYLEYLDQAISANELDWDIVAIVPRLTAEHLAMNLGQIRVVDGFDQLKQPFDLGIAVTPISALERCIQLTRNCVRWAVFHLDVIALRALPHLSQQMGSQYAFEFYAENADLTISISEFSRKDAMSLSPRVDYRRWSVTHLGVPNEFQLDKKRESPISVPDQSVLVLGNDSPHKQVQQSVARLLNAKWNVISISEQPAQAERHTVYRPGELDDEQLGALIQSVDVVVFPSIYEGFGLPISEVARIGTPLVVWDTEINHEVCASLNIQNVTYCSSFDQLAASTHIALSRDDDAIVGLRTAQEFFNEVQLELQTLMASPIDYRRLQDRWHLVELMAATAEENLARMQPVIERELIDELNSSRISNRVKAKIGRILSRSQDD